MARGSFRAVLLAQHAMVIEEPLVICFNCHCYGAFLKLLDKRSISVIDVDLVLHFDSYF